MASALDNLRCIRNAPFRMPFRILNVSTLLPITGGLTGLDAEVSKDFAAFADLATAEVEIGTTGYGYVDLTAAETAATSCIVQVKATNGSAVTFIKELEFEDCLDSGVCSAGTVGTATLPATCPFDGLADVPNGAIFEIVRGTGRGQIRTIVDCSTARVVNFDRNMGIAPGVDSVYIIYRAGGVKVGTDIRPGVNVESINDSTAAAANLAKLYKFLHAGTVAASPAPTTGSFASTTIGTFADDYFNDMLVVFEDGDAQGLSEKVGDFTGSTGLFTLSAVLGAAPTVGANFNVLGKIK